MNRLTYSFQNWWDYTGYGDDYSYHDGPRQDPRGDLVSSQVETETPFSMCTLDEQAPIFDIDVQVYLVESRTPGHYHLYCPTLTSKKKYLKAVKAMAAAGIVDPEWAKLTKKRGFGLLRRVND